MAKTSLHALTAVARLPGVSEAFLYYKTITQIISDKQSTYKNGFITSEPIVLCDHTKQLNNVLKMRVFYPTNK